MRPGVAPRFSPSVATPSARRNSPAARSAAARSTAAAGGTTRSARGRAADSSSGWDGRDTVIGHLRDIANPAWFYSAAPSRDLGQSLPMTTGVGFNGFMARAAVAAIAALEDDVRRALFEHVRGAAQPVTRESAAAAIGISRNLAAFHLDKLVELGLL